MSTSPVSLFDSAELGQCVSDKEFERQSPPLRTELLRAQHELGELAPFAAVVVVGGVDGAGKGDTVNTLFEWMDARYLVARAFGPPRKEELEYPPAWRYWRELPAKGRIAVLFGSWYTPPILRRAYGKIGDQEFEADLSRITAQERQLTDDGLLLIKVWLHLSKEQQARRLKRLSSDPRQSWRVTPTDWKHHRLYDTFLPICGRALCATSTEAAPWSIVEGTDRNYRELTVARLILDSLRRRLDQPPAPPAEDAKLRSPPPGGEQPAVLASLDLSKGLSRKKYDRLLDKWQGRLNRLSRRMQKKEIAAVLVFEGCDAAGKGGAIRRITRALDARYYDVIPIGAPSDEELARHYLWRFWRRLPRDGRMAIFDRSWYGRVLVERVEGLASPDEWRRAYQEINEFERQIVDHGAALLKFWLQIDKGEQLRRFEAREKTPYKEFKITAEDYRNREKWDEYAEAAEEMVAFTSTPQAPWTPVEANDKHFARIKVIKAVCRGLKARL